MHSNYKTPEARKRQYLDDAVSLIIVHANSQHDPDKVCKKAVQELADSSVVDYVYEFMAFHKSFVRHGGVIIDNNRCPGDYHINDLAGNDYVVVGGGLGNCHFGVYLNLLASRFTRKTTVHLPADAIYKAYGDEFDGEVEPASKLVDLTMNEFRRYENLAKIVSDDYEIIHDGKAVESSGDKKLKLMLWSSKEMMVEYLGAKLK